MSDDLFTGLYKALDEADLTDEERMVGRRVAEVLLPTVHEIVRMKRARATEGCVCQGMTNVHKAWVQKILQRGRHGNQAGRHSCLSY